MERGDAIGSLLVVVGVLFSVVANTNAKLLADVPLLQLLLGRFFLQWLLSASCCLMMRWRGVQLHIWGKPNQRMVMALRSAAYTCALGCVWCALRDLPVGEVTAIVYFNPVLCGVLAKVFLGEKVGIPFYLQAVTNSLGVFMVVGFPLGGGEGGIDLSPGEDGSNPARGIALSLCACVCFALGYCLIRLVDCHPLEMQVFSDASTTVSLMSVALAQQSMMTAVPVWDVSAWNRERILLLVLFTVCGLVASCCIIRGYQFSRASMAAPFMYTEVAAAFAVQIFIFKQEPEPQQLVGLFMIMGSAILRIAYEMRPSGETAERDGRSAIFFLTRFLQAGRNQWKSGALSALSEPLRLDHEDV